MKKILFATFFCLLLFEGSTAQAASGCCKVTTENVILENGQTVYVTMDSADCEARKGINTRVTFEEGRQASSDNKSCQDVSGTVQESKPSKPTPPQLQVSIPGFGKFSDVTCDDPATPCEFPWIAEYIKAIYNYGLGIIGILSVLVMMIGGVIRLTAGGNRAQISQGNDFIKSSVLGVIFTLCSYLILFSVNPNLTIFRPINVNYIGLKELPEMFIGDPVQISTLQSSPNSGKISLDQSTWQLIPQSNGLCMGSGARGAPSFVAKLKEAGDCLYKKNPQWCISGTAARDVSRQVYHYNKNCKNGKCSPPTCNPYPLGVAICPHTSGHAADLNRHVSFYNETSKCLKAVGFCRLCSEEWHWEFPQISPGCTCD
jgi:hypothetical protein